MRRIGWIIIGLTALSWLTAPSLAGRPLPCPASSDSAHWVEQAERQGWSWDVACDEGDVACERWRQEVKDAATGRSGKKGTSKKGKSKKGTSKKGTSKEDDAGRRASDGVATRDDDTASTQSGEGGEDMSGGKMTYYWASEPDVGYGSGPLGACDNPLVPFESVAVPVARWEELKGREVEIEGVCERCVVDDQCAGPSCKDFDLYVGERNDDGYDGVVPVRFRVGPRVPGHPCV